MSKRGDVHGKAMRDALGKVRTWLSAGALEKHAKELPKLWKDLSSSGMHVETNTLHASTHAHKREHIQAFQAVFCVLACAWQKSMAKQHGSDVEGVGGKCKAHKGVGLHWFEREAFCFLLL